MQCQSQILANSQPAAIDTIAKLRKLDPAWHRNVYPDCTGEERMEPFENIDSQTIERYNNNYIKSNGDQKFRYATLGKWTVDLKERLMKLSNDLENKDQHHMVIRANTPVRPRIDNSRFSSPIFTPANKLRDIK